MEPLEDYDTVLAYRLAVNSITLGSLYLQWWPISRKQPQMKHS